MVWLCGPNSERAVCRGDGSDRGDEDGHERVHDGVNGHAHVHVPCCDRGGASCRHHGHAIPPDQICHGRADLH